MAPYVLVCAEPIMMFGRSRKKGEERKIANRTGIVLRLPTNKKGDRWKLSGKLRVSGRRNAHPLWEPERLTGKGGIHDRGRDPASERKDKRTEKKLMAEMGTEGKGKKEGVDRERQR